MSKITGIGGVFLNISGDAMKLLNWYHKVLGLDITEYGVNFLMPNKFTLITFDNKESGRTVLNFTVDNLDDFLGSLKEKEVKIVHEIQVYAYGKFAQIEDILGNIVELWEPFDDYYIKMVQQEINDHSCESI